MRITVERTEKFTFYVDAANEQAAYELVNDLESGPDLYDLAVSIETDDIVITVQDDFSGPTCFLNAKGEKQ